MIGAALSLAVGWQRRKARLTLHGDWRGSFSGCWLAEKANTWDELEDGRVTDDIIPTDFLF